MNTISRRQMIQLLAAATAARAIDVRATTSSSRSVRGVAPSVPEMVKERVRPLPYESQQLGGIFDARMNINVDGRLLQIDEQGFLSSFAHRDGKDNAAKAWIGEHAGKFLDAACNAVRYRANADLERLLERVAKTLVACQEPDGYLGTYTADRRWTSWDVWVHKYNLIGLLSYYELTGDGAALTSCRMMGDLLVSSFGDGPGQRQIVTAGAHMGMAATSILEPICRLYRFSGDPRYLDFARYIVRAYDQPQGPRLVSSMLEHGSVSRTANGKAYEMLSNFVGLIDLYRLTADEKLLDTVMRAWEDVRRNQLYVTGTVSAGEHFQPPPRLLALPSSNVGETCATVTWLQLTWRLFRLTGEARFGQEIERTVYNHLLAAQDERSGDVCYYTALTGRKEYSHSILCCVSSGPRGISLIPALTWGLEDKAFIVNLYTPGRATFEIDGVRVQVISRTRFPSEGDVVLSVDPERATAFTVRLRVPEWTTRFQVTTGSTSLVGTAGQMLDVTRKWKPASTLRIRMVLPVRELSGAPTYSEFVALQRGPQLLALDKSLNPAVPYLHRAAVSHSSRLVATPVVPPRGWIGRQVYEVAGIAGIKESDEDLRPTKRSLLFAPFADTVDYRVWLTREDRARFDVPAVTAYARAYLSTSPWLAAANERHPETDTPESLTDENPKTFCIIDPRDPTLASYLGGPKGKRGDLVWCAVILDRPAAVSRIVFRHGPLSASDGWFDTAGMKPQIQVVRTSIPRWGSSPFPDLDKANWEPVAEMESYPPANAITPPNLADRQPLEVKLPKPLIAYAVRVVAKPGGDYASCAELSAYI